MSTDKVCTLKVILILVGSLLLSSCNFGYYVHVVSGHLGILNKKQDIDELIQNPQTSQKLIKKLKLIKDVRAFAIQQIQLPEVNSYTAYVDVGRPYVTKVVTASSGLKLKSYNWCYLFAGCLEYRGYFDPQEAETYASDLKKEGWDVAVGGVSAYSTGKWLNNDYMLDYFKDPVLNTFLQRSPTNIIQTLIHEMAHQVVFIAGDTAFNESFAVFVEQEGIRQYLKSREKNSQKQYEHYLLRQKDKSRFLEIIKTHYQKFEKLYASQLHDEEKLVRKEKLFEEMRLDYHQQKNNFKVLDYSQWFDRPLNNAHLLGIRTYNNLVPAFEKIFQEQDQDWEKYFKKIKEISAYPKEERMAYLESRKSLSTTSTL